MAMTWRDFSARLSLVWKRVERKGLEYVVVCKELDAWDARKIAARLLSRGTSYSLAQGELRFEKALRNALKAKKFPRIVRDPYTTPADPAKLDPENYDYHRNAEWIEIYKK